MAPGRTLTLMLSDAEAAARAIAAFAATRPLAAVVPTDDQTALVAAHAAARLGLPHNPPDAALAARRKHLLRDRLNAAGVRTPGHRLISLDPPPDDAALAARAREQAYPCVLKPTSLSASRGVIRADTPEAFITAFRRIEALLRRPDVLERAGEDGRRSILVEEFVPGDEVAVEGLLIRGRLKVLALFDKPDRLDGPFFEETIYVTPSRHPAPVQEAILKTTADGARALGLVEGPVHAELRVGPAGAWIIEVAARSIGGLCGRVLRFGAGIGLEELILTHALGRDVDALERELGSAGVMMIPVPRAGILRAVNGLAAARAVPGIVDITLSATLGQPLVPWPEGAAYPGFIYARGDSPAAVESALREAHQRLKFVLD